MPCTYMHMSHAHAHAHVHVHVQHAHGPAHVHAHVTCACACACMCMLCACACVWRTCNMHTCVWLRGSNGNHSLPFRVSEPILFRSIRVSIRILNAAPPLAGPAIGSLGHIFIIVKPIANELPVLALPRRRRRGRRRRGRRQRWRRRRRLYAHVTVTPTVRVAVNTPLFCAAPRTLASIGVAAVTVTQSVAQRWIMHTCTCTCYAADSHMCMHMCMHMCVASRFEWRSLTSVPRFRTHSL